MSSHFPLRAALAALCLATSATHAAPDGDIDPQQTQTCNEPPALSVEGGGRLDATQVTGDPLKPGETQDSLGTNAALASELDGFFVYSQTRDFSFVTGDGKTVAGKYTEAVMRGKDDKCKCHLQIAVQRGCIDQVVIQHFKYPKTRLVADWRTDFPGNVPSEKVQRSAVVNGESTITFHMADGQPVCKGQTSRWLLLNTNITQVTEGNHLQFVTPQGHGSGLFPFHVPSPP
jgi:hypothetical protein